MVSTVSVGLERNKVTPLWKGQQFISVRIYDKQALTDVVPAVVVISLIHEANEGFARFYRSIPMDVPRSAKARA